MNKNRQIYISPSILSADFANLERDVKLVENGGADWIHVDVMDGHFVPNITIGAPVVKALRKVTDKQLDVHLMIETPEKYLEDFIEAGSDIITIHYEACKNNLLEMRDKVRKSGVKFGVSIKPKTSPEVLKQYLSEIDMVLIMTVEPGFGGQAFMQDSANKIKNVRENASEDLIIQVDGGINDITGRICTDLGANSLVAGSYIYSATDVRIAINSLKI